MSSDIILGLGDDQLASQYQVIFPEGIPGGGNGERISLRMDADLDLPEDTVETYDISFKGMKITQTSMTHGMDKKITLTVRLDQQWKVFDDLQKWYKMCYDPLTATAMPDLATRTNILIQTNDASQKIVKTIRLKNAKITSLKIGTFDHTSSDPIKLTLNFIFSDMIVE